MRGRHVSMDGLGVPFAVPGERHENLPAGGFAGSPVRSVDHEPLHFERATGGDGMFAGGPDATSFGTRMMVGYHPGMGDLFSDAWNQYIKPALSQGASAAGA